MQLNRIYSANPLATGTETDLSSEASRHVGRVLRLRAGDTLHVFDDSGAEWACELIVADRSQARIAVGELVREEPEPSKPITVWHGLCRGARMDSVMQKSTELGASKIQPMLTEYCVVKLDEPRSRKRMEHWRRIAISAAEQSGRCRIPAITKPLPFANLMNDAPADHTRIIFDPTGTENLAETLRPGLPVIACTGPEGGFSEAELNIAAAAGFHSVGLGPRILRTETAPVVALSLIQLLAGDFCLANQDF